jgi:hypothetical protein
MPFVSGENWRRIQEENAQLHRTAAELEPLRPFLHIARQLHGRVVELLEADTAGGVDAGEIGRLAYQAVMTEQVDKARRGLAVTYEREHRKELYARVLVETEAREGEAIMASVVTRLKTDAKLAAELHQSARNELTARAKGVVAGKISQEQQKAIDVETERQIALDRLDVAFALEGRLDLAGEAVTSLLKPDDKLVVHFDKDALGQAGLALTWQQDVNGVTGWVMDGPVIQSTSRAYKSYTQVRVGSCPKDRFVTPGTQMPDLVNGGSVTSANSLIAGYPLTLGWQTNSGRGDSYALRLAVQGSENSYSSSVLRTPEISTIDFQTRDLAFASAQA